MDINRYKSMEPFFGQWYIKEKLGEGGFGQVFVIEKEDFGYVSQAALKVITIPKDDSDIRKVQMEGNNPEEYYRELANKVFSECILMGSLKGNSNIVNCDDYSKRQHEDGIGWDIFIKMELLTPLLRHIEKNSITTKDVINIGVDICQALELCHKNNIVHRDVKPENIFISSNGDYKLGDFGIAKSAESVSGGTKIGTHAYMAPEIYNAKPYGTTVDIYSLGVVLYCLLNKLRGPFLPSNGKLTVEAKEIASARRMRGDEMSAPIFGSSKLNSIILKACVHNPENRYATAYQMREALKEVRDQEENIVVYPVNADSIELSGFTEETQKVIEIPFEKTIRKDYIIRWADEDNNDGLRPEKIIVSLSSYGSKVSDVEVSEKDGWKCQFDDITENDAYGNRIPYKVTIEEDIPTYDCKIAEDVVFFIHEIEKIDIQRRIEWDDHENQDGLRPERVSMALTADAKEINIIDLKIEEDNIVKFDNYPKYCNGGVEINYGIVIFDDISGYEIIYEEERIICRHQPIADTIDIEIHWEDKENQDGLRPDALDVQLCADGTIVAQSEVLVSDGWKAYFSDMPRYRDGGKTVKYTAVIEKEIQGYKVECGALLISCMHETEKKAIEGNITWEDQENQDGIRPSELEVRLYKDGEFSGSVMTNEISDWRYRFQNIDAFKNHGIPCSYEVKIDREWEAYQSSIDAYEISMHHAVEKIEISGFVKWEDYENQDGIRPEALEVQLLADGSNCRIAAASEETGWSYSFDGLDRYRDRGIEIAYSAIVTITPINYDVSNEKECIICTHEPEKTELNGNVLWEDFEDKYEIRPNAFQLKLLADGREVNACQVSESSDWNYGFSGLSKYRDGGIPIVYTVEPEEELAGFKSEFAESHLICRHEIEYIDIDGKIIWDDEDDNDGIRPAEVSIQLFADGRKIADAVIKEKNDWNISFEGMEKYGLRMKEISYSIGVVCDIERYVTESSGMEIVCRHVLETISVYGSLYWQDKDDQDGIRPESCQICLKADGADMMSQEISSSNNWEYAFADIQKFKDGLLINYAVKLVDEINAYECIYKENGIELFHSIENTNVSGRIQWEDVSDNDGIRPEQICVKLMSGDAAIAEQNIFGEHGWEYLFENVDRFEDGGKEIQYTVTLSEKLPGYEAEDLEKEIILRHAIEKVNIAGRVKWDDQDNQDGVRVSSCRVSIFADGIEVDSCEVTEASSWSYVFYNLPKYKEGGVLLAYSVEVADSMEGYEISITGNDISCRHKPAVITIDGVVTWKDYNDNDGMRPETICVQLIADGKYIDEQVTSDDREWKVRFENVDKYSMHGKEISYSIRGQFAPEGYEMILSGEELICSHFLLKRNIEGRLIWEDCDNQDGVRPEKCQIRLIANESEVIILEVNKESNWNYEFANANQFYKGEPAVYMAELADDVVSYDVKYQGNDIVLRHTVEKIDVDGYITWEDDSDNDGMRPDAVTLKLMHDNHSIAEQIVLKDSGWKYIFKEVDRYYDGGKEIKYSAILAENIDGYEIDRAESGLSLKHSIEKLAIAGNVNWEDQNNKDGIRPQSCIVRLIADREEICQYTTSESNGWNYEFEDIPRYRKGGIPILYRPGMAAPIAGYGVLVDGYDLYCTHIPEVIMVEGQVVWDDYDNNDAMRPDLISLNLLADGESIITKETSAEQDWKVIFDGVDRYSLGGKEIEYSLRGQSILNGYEMTASGMKVSYAHRLEQKNLEGRILWEDSNNQDGVRPKKCLVRLLSGEKAIQEQEVTESGNWKYAFIGVNTYCQGVKINYSVELSEEVADYEIAKIENDILLRHNVAKICADGVIVWDDNYDNDGIRPLKVGLKLMQGAYCIAEASTGVEDEWRFIFDNLDQFYDGGKELKYSVRLADNIEGYSEVEAESGIILGHDIERINLSESICWDDRNDQDGIRPELCTIRLLADGIECLERTTSEAENWNYLFDNVQSLRDGGIPIQYTVEAVEKVEGYEVTCEGIRMEYTHHPEMVAIEGTIIWEDDHNNDGIRPEEISVKLMKGNCVVAEISTGPENGWSYTFADVDRYFDGGKEIAYSIIGGYILEGYEMATSGWDVRYSHSIERRCIAGKVHWEDRNNQDGIRPDAVMVALLADGRQIDRKMTSQKDAWEYSFEEIAVFRDKGIPIDYQIGTDGILSGYDCTIDHMNVIYKHAVDTVSIERSIIWEDDNNNDGIRPQSLAVALAADGMEVSFQKVSQNDGWNAKLGSFDRCSTDGKEIEYAIACEMVPLGYEMEYINGNIRLTHIIEKDAVAGRIVWKDEENCDGLRPEKLTVLLMADGKEQLEYETSEEEGWKYEFKDIPMFRDRGIFINYTVDLLDGIDRYEIEIDVFDVIASHRKEMITIDGSVIWKDAFDRDGERPGFIFVVLLENGMEINMVAVSEANNWKYAFHNLPVYTACGEQRTYQISFEDEIDEYCAHVEGYDIICEYENFNADETDEIIIKNLNNISE